MAEHLVVYRLDKQGRWVSVVRGLAKCRGRGRTIREARQSLRASLARLVEDPYEIDFVEDVKLPGPARALLVRHWRARRLLEKAQAAARAETTHALAGLRALKVGVRDASDLLGIPPLKLQKLLKG